MSKSKNKQGQLELKEPPKPTRPKFLDLLKKPLLGIRKLPDDFSIEEETEHLNKLWEATPSLQGYLFEKFVHAGGSGMVFKSKTEGSDTIRALKIVRKKIIDTDPEEENAVKSLSPLSRRELEALQKIQHPNVVRLFDSIENDRGIIAIATSYIENPKPVNEYLSETLQKSPKGIEPFSPIRLDNACNYLIHQMTNVADALSHMHDNSIYHFDIKPDNILTSIGHISITDLGSCVDITKIPPGQPLKVQFSWTYAHLELQSLLSKPAGISGGGLKVSARVNDINGLERFDLFSLGRTIQECLAMLHKEFGERCYASYGFRFLHLIACLLLDGHNAPIADPADRVIEHDGVKFINDVAMGYHTKFFKDNRIVTSRELLERLRRHSKQYSWNETIPELDVFQPKTINTGVGKQGPFTKRVAAIVQHPSVRRLKTESQLGWMKEIYPNATHNRWSHTLGTLASTVDYYNSLLSDPEVPTVRIVIDSKDVEHGLIAALLHDLGQSSFGHDFEEACPGIFDHSKIVDRILNEDHWGRPTLKETINRYWPRIKIKRIFEILQYGKKPEEIASPKEIKDKSIVDGLAADIIDGPIDADKFDYLFRDGKAAGLPYTLGIDRERFLRALSVTTSKDSSKVKMCLAYKAKGTPAIESLLLARYQMYNALYWHHTFRCIKAMFAAATHMAFGNIKDNQTVNIRGAQINNEDIRDIYYHIIICAMNINDCKKILGKNKFPKYIKAIPPQISSEKALEIVWVYGDDDSRYLLEKLGNRELFKRVFEISIGEIGDAGKYYQLSAEMSTEKRLIIANNIKLSFIDSIHKRMQIKAEITTTYSDERAREKLQRLSEQGLPLIVVDFPIRGIPDERNFPSVIGDSARKYIDGYLVGSKDEYNIFEFVKKLQQCRAKLRIYAESELHTLIVRYLMPGDVKTIIESEISIIKK